MTAIWPPKDPDEVLDYGMDWSPRGLGTDTIETTTATVLSGGGEGGVVKDSHGVASIDGVPEGQGTVTWLSGGLPDTTAVILLHANTLAGRQLEETVEIRIRQR